MIGMDVYTGMKNGTLVKGRYRIGCPLGAGGCGNVFAAFDEADGGVPVAVKIQRDRTFELTRQFVDDRERFVAERDYLQRLSGIPGIPRYRDHGEYGDSQFIVMDQLSGEPLDGYIVNPGVHATEVAASVIDQLCEIVEEIHRRNLVHRDIKPENVIVGDNGDIRLLDVGFALPISFTPEKPYGTAGFAAPEQYHQGTPATVACDIYSLGCVLFAMLNLQPYGGNARDARRDAAAFGPETTVTVDPGLYRLGCEMVAVDPAARPAGSRAVRRRLIPFLPVPGAPRNPKLIGPDVTARYRKARCRR
ncbi:MAG TPA: serine/threonine-protein kinase [Streptosporangiaceae bacterium]|jgi:serine/threonine-protein kinase